MYFWDGRRLTDFPLRQGVPAELFEKVHNGLHVLAARIASDGVRAVFVCHFLIVLVTFISLLS